MKKSSKIIIGVAVFIVTMGVIVTAVVMAVLTAKKNAELYTAEYTFVSDRTVDGAYIAVQDGNYVLARNGAVLSDRYAYLEYVGDGKFYYRDNHGGCGFIDTDGDVFGKVKQGTTCLYAESGYTLTVEGDTVRAGSFSRTLADGETVVEDYTFNRILPKGTAAIERDGAVTLYGEDIEIALGNADVLQPTVAAGLLFTGGDLFSIAKRAVVCRDVSDWTAVYMGEWAIGLPDALITSDGETTLLGDGEFVTRHHVVKSDTATYSVEYTFMFDGTKYLHLRDGKLVDAGTPFETPEGLCLIDGRDVKNIAGNTIRSFKVDVEPVAGAYAVQYDDEGNNYGRSAGHYIEPLDGKSFACPTGTEAVFDTTGAVAYVYRDGTTVKTFNEKGKETDSCADRSGDVTVAGGRIFIADGDAVWWGKTEIDGVSYDGKFAFRTEQGKLTVIKTETGAETYFYTAGMPQLEITPFGTVVTDGKTGLKGFVSDEGKLTIRLSYTHLKAYNGYLTLGVDDDIVSIADYKGKLLYGGIIVESLQDLGACAYVETGTGALIVDAHGRDLVDAVTGRPTKLIQTIDWHGQAAEAVQETQSYYVVTSGKLRLIRTVCSD